jgi:hypothetical protein
MNMMNVSNRTFPKQKRGRIEKEVEIFLLTATGDIRDTPTREYRKHKKVKRSNNDEFFVVWYRV